MILRLELGMEDPKSTPIPLVLPSRRWDGFSCCYLLWRCSSLVILSSEQLSEAEGLAGLE
jgi:hypothetical protein